jgi:hypothetical protein
MVTLAPASCFTKEHYEAHRGLAPAPLCELVVHCLELVATLADLGLGFRFKGGNSLLVMLEDPQRFSIDVDIATAASKEELVGAAENVVARGGPFTRWEARQPKTKPWLPLISFKLFFESCYRPPEEAFVMLDAVLEESPYPGERRPVRCGALYAADQAVEVPTVPGLIGDKLLTIGPSTLGIPIGRGKAAQRLKHVFDVSLLGSHGYDRALVWQSLCASQAQEERIQGRQFSFQEIAADTVRFCGEALGHAEPPRPEDLPEATYLYEVALGFGEFREHLFRRRYGWQDLKSDCQCVIEMMRDIDQSG